MSNTSDVEIIRQVVHGDIEAFRELVVRHQSAVLRMIVGYVGDRHEAEDLAQEVFLAAFQHLSKFDPNRSKFLTWLATIARNRCLNRLRKRDLATSPIQDPPGGSLPEEEASNKEVLLALDRALLDLPVEQRTAFLLVEVENQSYEEVARAERVPIGTVKSRISRAREKLRQVFQVAASDSDHG